MGWGAKNKIVIFSLFINDKIIWNLFISDKLIIKIGRLL